MFNQPIEKSELQKARDAVAAIVVDLDPETDPHFEKTVKAVTELSNCVAAENPQQRQRLNPNTVYTGLINVGIAVVVVGYESRNVIRTEALKFLMRAL